MTVRACTESHAVATLRLSHLHETKAEALTAHQLPDGEATAPVLVVDDDQAIRTLFVSVLRAAGVRAIAVATGEDAFAVLDERKISAMLLDSSLPDTPVADLLTQLRDRDDARTLPVIVVTDESDIDHRVTALEAGADDYLTKPFSPRELLARIRTVLRRRRAEMRQGRPDGVRAYRFDGWELNLGTRRLTSPAGHAVTLTNGEFRLLVVLLGAPQRILSRDQLLDLSRLHNDEVYNRSIDVQIMRLRRKLEKDVRNPRYILTERRVGYLFGVAVETVY